MPTGTINIEHPTSSVKILTEKVAELYDRIINPDLLVRRLTLSINRLIHEEDVKSRPQAMQLDLFTDYEELKRQQEAEEAELAKERRRQEAVLKIKKMF